MQSVIELVKQVMSYRLSIDFLRRSVLLFINNQLKKETEKRNSIVF
jgi:hypothetical protein